MSSLVEKMSQDHLPLSTQSVQYSMQPQHKVYCMIQYTDTYTCIVAASSSSVHKYQLLHISHLHNTNSYNIHTIMSDEFCTQFHPQYIILTVLPLGSLCVHLLTLITKVFHTDSCMIYFTFERLHNPIIPPKRTPVVSGEWTINART